MVSQIQCEPLAIKHKDLLSPIWKSLTCTYDLKFSEYSFANDFIFRKTHNYAFVDSDPPFLKGHFRSGHPYLIPACHPKFLKVEMIKAISKDPLCLFPVPECWLKEFDKNLFNNFSCRADADYLFKIEKLKTLSGRTLSSRRNLLTQLHTHHAMRSIPLTSKEIPEALKILEEWQANAKLPKEKTDYYECHDALDFFEQLDVFGRIAYADGNAVGFTIGELLTPKTAVMHIAKSLHSYKGITPYLYQDFAMHLPDSVDWINLEQDLGLTSLRKAKEAYDPDLLLSKWRVSCDKAAKCE